MRSAVVKISVFLMLFLLPVHVFATQASGEEDACADFAQSLFRCDKPFSCEKPHGSIPDYVIRHEIDGLKDERCVHRQTLPDGSWLECRYDEGARYFIALQADAEVGKQADDQQKEKMDSIFRNFCSVL